MTAFEDVIEEEIEGAKRDYAREVWAMNNVTDFRDLGRRPTKEQAAAEYIRLFGDDE